MDTIIIHRRYGEWLDVRQLVQPHDFMVGRVVDRLKSDGHHTIRGAWNWVLDHIRYPPGPPMWEDLHIEYRFTWGVLPIPRFASVSRDFWQYPSETLAAGMGDCKDSAILLCSMLRHVMGSGQVFVSVGRYRGNGHDFGHAWVSIRDEQGWGVLDTTLTGPVPARARVYEYDGGPYVPVFRFNDQTTLRVSGQALPRRIR